MIQPRFSTKKSLTLVDLGLDETQNYSLDRTKTGNRKLSSLSLTEKMEIIGMWEHRSEFSPEPTKSALGRLRTKYLILIG